jgi:catechol-2,3-dioxygenase
MSNELLGTIAHIGEAKTPAPKITGFHHIAYRCRDADETRKFYVDLLGLKPAAALAFDRDPGGRDRPFMHLFFEMGDGKFIAFFDEPGSADDATRAELDDFIARLKEAKVPVFGPIDHHFCHSIYFFDPNGLACEITVRDAKHDAIMEAEGGRVAQAIREWTEKTRALKKARLKLLNAAD